MVTKKVKKKQTRAEKQAELEQKQLTSTRIVQARGSKRVQEVATGELKNVMADTVERCWDEMFHRAQWKRFHKRYSAEETALILLRGILFDATPATIREHDFGDIPYCKEHRE